MEVRSKGGSTAAAAGLQDERGSETLYIAYCEQLSAYCQEAQRLLAEQTSALHGERQARLNAETSLQMVLSSRRWRISGLVVQLAASLHVRAALAKYRSWVAQAKPLVWRIASSIVPLRYYPKIVIDGAISHGFSEHIRLLHHSSSPTKQFALCGQQKVLEVPSRCNVEQLARVALYVDTSRLNRPQTIDLVISEQGAVLRRVCLSSDDVLLGTLAVFEFAPIPDSKGKTLTLTLSTSEGEPGNCVLLPLFGSPKLRSVPWQYARELGIRSDAVPTEMLFIPGFYAQADLSDYRVSVGWRVPSSDHQYVTLVGDRVVAFSFEAPEPKLSFVQVVFGTFCRRSDAIIQLELVADGFSWKAEFSADPMRDNQPFKLPIPDDIFEAIRGRFVTVKLSSPQSREDNKVAILGCARPQLCDLSEIHQTGWTNLRGVRPFALSEIVGVPSLRRVFIDADRPLRISLVVAEKTLLPWMKDFVRALEATLSALGQHAVLFCQPDDEAFEGSLRHSDLLVVFEQQYTAQLRKVVTEVKGAYGIVLGCLLPRLSNVIRQPNEQPVLSDAACELFRACDALFSIEDVLKDSLSKIGPKRVFSLPYNCDVGQVGRVLSAVLDEHKTKSLPRVSIVTVLYKKEREIPYFVEALAAQDYLGEVELVVVDDCSPDNSVRALHDAYQNALAAGRRLPRLTLISNEKNLGNCGSRNRAIQDVSGDLVVIVDCDCLLNRSFVSAHVYSHRFHRADVVIGPCNLETGTGEPLLALDDFDRNRSRIMQEAQLQDGTNLNSFVNCITRNFSIKKRAITEKLFDEQFGYSAHPDSGFGWEDVEMGYRLYKRGLNIHFTQEAFSVHISHPSTTDDKVKPLKSLKNFRRLVEKHPAIRNEARRWYLDTFHKIEGWSKACGHQPNDDQNRIQELAGQMYPYPFAISTNRKPRILTYRWHVPHQYELYKLPYDFTLLGDLDTGFTRVWEPEQRPQPRNAVFKRREEIRVRDYDLAIVHFDENVLSPEYCNGVIQADWGANFKWFIKELHGIPKVAVCHGTPQFIGQYNPDYEEPDLGTPIQASRELLVDFLGDVPVVCNSYQAAREWSFRSCRVIWHGFDPSEFQLTDYNGGILTLGKAMRERHHYRGYKHFKEVCELLPADLRPVHHTVQRPSLFTPEMEIYARLKFEAYKASIRDNSVYFNPTLRSPMPRSRGEAMMSGLVTVSAANHDVQLFIKNGVNGFYADSSEEMAEYLLYLMKNKKACRELGRRSRDTAIDVFNHDRYLHAWQTLVRDIVG